MRLFCDNTTKSKFMLDQGKLFIKTNENQTWNPSGMNHICPEYEIELYVNKKVSNNVWKEIVNDVVVSTDIPRRGYVFVHRSITGMYAGIQAAHAMIKLAHNQYSNPDMIEWVTNHETLVILDGGNCDQMNYIKGILSNSDNVSMEFKEPDMGGMVTAIAYVPSEDEASEIEFYKKNPQSGSSGNPVINLLLTSKTHRG